VQKAFQDSARVTVGPRNEPSKGTCAGKISSDHQTLTFSSRAVRSNGRLSAVDRKAHVMRDAHKPRGDRVAVACVGE
jgi:hypothetical protein